MDSYIKNFGKNIVNKDNYFILIGLRKVKIFFEDEYLEEICCCYD